jgi:hypothetical protein
MYVAVCSPERLRRMQQVFDAVWRELKNQKSLHTFPWAIEATRFTIARLVLEHGGDLTNVDLVKQDVLDSLESLSANTSFRNSQNLALSNHQRLGSSTADES